MRNLFVLLAWCASIFLMYSTDAIRMAAARHRERKALRALFAGGLVTARTFEKVKLAVSLDSDEEIASVVERLEAFGVTGIPAFHQGKRVVFVTNTKRFLKVIGLPSGPLRDALEAQS